MQGLGFGDADSETKEAGSLSEPLCNGLEARLRCVPIKTQFLAKRISWINFSVVLVVPPSLRWLSRELSSPYLRYIPLSRSRKACFNTQAKGRMNRTGASTQPCITPLEMLNGAEVTAVEH